MRALKVLALAGLLGAAFAAQAAPVRPTSSIRATRWCCSAGTTSASPTPPPTCGIGEGTLVFDEPHPAKSSVEVTLPLANLDTHVSALDEHLKKPDFFDADKYPVVTFKSTRVQPLGGNKFKVTGDLTVHGVTKPVVLDATLNKVGMHPMTEGAGDRLRCHRHASSARISAWGPTCRTSATRSRSASPPRVRPARPANSRFPRGSEAAPATARPFFVRRIGPRAGKAGSSAVAPASCRERRQPGC